MRTKQRKGKLYALVKRDGIKRWIDLDDVRPEEVEQHKYRHGKPRQFAFPTEGKPL